MYDSVNDSPYDSVCDTCQDSCADDYLSFSWPEAAPRVDQPFVPALPPDYRYRDLCVAGANLTEGQFDPMSGLLIAAQFEDESWPEAFPDGLVFPEGAPDTLGDTLGDTAGDSPPSIYDRKYVGNVTGARPPGGQCMAMKDTPPVPVGTGDPNRAFSYYMNIDDEDFTASFTSPTAYDSTNYYVSSTFFIGGVSACPDMLEIPVAGPNPLPLERNTLLQRANFRRFQARHCYDYYILNHAQQPWYVLERPGAMTRDPLTLKHPDKSILNNCQPLIRGDIAQELQFVDGSDPDSDKPDEEEHGFAPVLRYPNDASLDEAEYVLGNYLQATWNANFVGNPGGYKLDKKRSASFNNINLPCIEDQPLTIWPPLPPEPPDPPPICAPDDENGDGAADSPTERCEPPWQPIPPDYNYQSPQPKKYYCPNVEKVIEPGHPYSPRRDIVGTDRDYSDLTSQKIVPIYCPPPPAPVTYDWGFSDWNVPGARTPQQKQKYPIVQCGIVPVDILSFRAAAFDNCITQRINYDWNFFLEKWVEAGKGPTASLLLTEDFGMGGIYAGGYPLPCKLRFYESDTMNECPVRMSIQQCCRILVKDVVPANFLKLRTCEGLRHKRAQDPSLQSKLMMHNPTSEEQQNANGCGNLFTVGPHPPQYTWCNFVGVHWDNCTWFETKADPASSPGCSGAFLYAGGTPWSSPLSQFHTSWPPPPDVMSQASPSCLPATCPAPSGPPSSPSGTVRVNITDPVPPNMPIGAQGYFTALSITKELNQHVCDDTEPVEYQFKSHFNAFYDPEDGKLVGYHMPYMRWWDTGASAGQKYHGGSFVNTLSSFDTLIGVGREERNQEDIEEVKHLADSMASDPNNKHIQYATSQVRESEMGRWGGWTELKAHAMQTIRRNNLFCVGRYEKLVKPGDQESLALAMAGSGYTSVNSVQWPWSMGWRGYASDTHGRNFPMHFTTPSGGALLAGLDNALEGDIIIYNIANVTHVAYVTGIGGFAVDGSNTPLPDKNLKAEFNYATGRFEQGGLGGPVLHPTRIYIKSWDDGKFPTSTGSSIMWGMGPERTIYKVQVPTTYRDEICEKELRALIDPPSDSPPSPGCRDLVADDTLDATKCKDLNCQPTCEDSNYSACILPNTVAAWNGAIIYRPRSDTNIQQCPSPGVPVDPSGPAYNLGSTYAWPGYSYLPTTDAFGNPTQQIDPASLPGPSVISQANSSKIFTNSWAYCVNDGYDPPSFWSKGYKGPQTGAMTYTSLCGPEWGKLQRPGPASFVHSTNCWSLPSGLFLPQDIAQYSGCNSAIGYVEFFPKEPSAVNWKGQFCGGSNMKECLDGGGWTYTQQYCVPPGGSSDIQTCLEQAVAQSPCENGFVTYVNTGFPSFKIYCGSWLQEFPAMASCNLAPFPPNPPAPAPAP